MKPTTTVLVSLWAITAIGAPTNESPLTVDLGYATYRGFINPNTGNTQFLGIRYAATPTGDLRWREPRAPPPIPGILDARALPPNCYSGGAGTQPQHPYGTVRFPVGPHAEVLEKRQNPPNRSEDCLHLNVYVPGSTPSPAERSEPLPVVVWIHGGGYVSGGAGNDGNDLITAANGGVVVVQIQYRVGLFGFLAGKKVKEGGVLNAGLLDQQFALQWVQRHIHKFGGDPRQVTIWGQSAGAGSVVQHLVANGGNTTPPLFQGAITSSTFLPSQYNYDDAMPESLYNQTASLSGCDASEDSLACLRGLEASALQEINAALCASGFQGTFVFVPVVDGTFIKERPSVTFRRGRLNGKRLLAVTNTHEGRMFVNPNATWLETENYASQLFPLFGPSQASAAAIVYRSFSSDYDKASAIMGESIFTCPTYFLLEAFKGPSYKGHFAVPPANHAGDVAYYYPSNGLPAWNNLEFRKAFSEAFLSFVMTGDPNARRDPETTPEWRRWSSSNPVELLFNSTEAGDAPQIEAITTARDLRRRCDFWERVVGLSGQ